MANQMIYMDPKHNNIIKQIKLVTKILLSI